MRGFFLNLIRFIRSIKNGLLIIANILFILSVLSNIVSPVQYSIIALFGFLFFSLFLFHVLIVMLYFKRRKRIAFTAFVLLIWGSFYIRNTFNFSVNNHKEGIKVMSWNVKNFDLYNWTKNNETRQKMLELIRKTNPDILSMQEFYTNKKNFNNIAAVTALGYPYYYFQPTFSQKDSDQWGIAIFSKYPLSHKYLLPSKDAFSKSNRSIKATAKTPSGEINIYASHFQSIHLHNEDYQYIDSVKKEFGGYDFLKTSKIISKIIPKYKYRVGQIETLLQDIYSSRKMAIVCCDLNDIPNSYCYQLLDKVLIDAFKEKGTGFSNTISIVIPLLRIDYIFATKGLKVNGYEKIDTQLSDHNIVISYIQ